jgi:hypothetical protein
MFRNADCLGDPAPVHVRHLTGKIDRHTAINTGCRKNGTGLEASRNEPVVDQAQWQYLIRLANRRCVIAAAGLEICRNVVWNVVQLRCAVGNSCLFVDDGRQHLIPNINELQRVMGRLACLGNDERNAFPDKRTLSTAITRRSGTTVPGMTQLGLMLPIFPERSVPGSTRRTPGAARAPFALPAVGSRRLRHSEARRSRAAAARGCTNDRAVGPGSCALAEIAGSCSNFCNGPAMRF